MSEYTNLQNTVGDIIIKLEMICECIPPPYNFSIKQYAEELEKSLECELCS